MCLEGAHIHLEGLGSGEAGGAGEVDAIDFGHYYSGAEGVPAVEEFAGSLVLEAYEESGFLFGHGDVFGAVGGVFEGYGVPVALLEGDVEGVEMERLVKSVAL